MQSGGEGDVYLLSIPGFVWFKANDTSAAPRAGHTCEFAGGRQMISIGGLDPTATNFNNGYLMPDNNTKTLGVFDLVDLTWKTEYDSNAQPYTLPAAVQSWYSSP